MPALLSFLYSFSFYLSIAAQQCSNGDIRLTGGTITMNSDAYYLAGGIQVCENSQWSTVCHNGWSSDDATVTCRQLGLMYTGTLCQDSCYGNIQTSTTYRDFRCTGSETTLLSCRHQRRGSCSSAAGVNCKLNIQHCTTGPGPTSPAITQTDSTIGFDGDHTKLVPDNNNTHSTPAQCSQNLETECSKCLENNRSKSDLAEGRDRGMDSDQICNNSSYTVGIVMGIITLLLVVALVTTAVSLIMTCSKLHKSKSTGTVSSSSRGIDNQTYGETEVPASNPQSFRQGLPSSSTIAAKPVAMKTTSERGQEGIAEAFYDIITAEQAAECNEYSTVVNNEKVTLKTVTADCRRQGSNVTSLGESAVTEELQRDVAYYNVNKPHHNMYSAIS